MCWRLGRRAKCQKHCVLNATAKEPLPVLHVVALAKNPSWVFQSATAKDAAELADAAAMFVVVRAKSNLEVLNGNLRKRPPASIHLREHLRQLGEVRRH